MYMAILANQESAYRKLLNFDQSHFVIVFLLPSERERERETERERE